MYFCIFFACWVAWVHLFTFICICFECTCIFLHISWDLILLALLLAITVPFQQVLQQRISINASLLRLVKALILTGLLTPAGPGLPHWPVSGPCPVRQRARPSPPAGPAQSASGPSPVHWLALALLSCSSWHTSHSQHRAGPQHSFLTEQLQLSSHPGLIQEWHLIWRIRTSSSSPFRRTGPYICILHLHIVKYILWYAKLALVKYILWYAKIALYHDLHIVKYIWKNAKHAKIAKIYQDLPVHLNLEGKQVIDISSCLDIELRVKSVKLRPNKVAPLVVKPLDLIFFFMQWRSGLVLFLPAAGQETWWDTWKTWMLCMQHN